MTRSDERALRDAIAAWAHELPDPNTGARATCFSISECQKVLDAAGITSTPDELARASVQFRRMPFYGGNYTLDARRILRAMQVSAADEFLLRISTQDYS